MKRLLNLLLCLSLLVSARGQSFVSINFPTDICVGDTVPISFGYNSQYNISLTVPQVSLARSERIFLPDGVNCGDRPNNQGCYYESPVHFTQFQPGATITSVEDIRYVRLEIEHSWIGDIYIGITCPNGQSADILRYGGSGTSPCNSSIPQSSRGWHSGSNCAVSTYFGAARDGEGYPSCDSSVSGNRPGTPWNYCWSDNSTAGYTYGAASAGGYCYRAANETNGMVDSSNVAAGTRFYHPDESFTSLVGCPLNGDWSIRVQDGWSGDNGWLYSWELSLQPFLINNDTCDLVYRDIIGPHLTRVHDSLYLLHPPVELHRDTLVDYTLRMLNSCGDTIDTLVSVRLHPIYEASLQADFCDTATWYGGQWTTIDSTLSHRFETLYGCDSIWNLQARILHGDTVDFDTAACLPIAWHDLLLDEPGTYRHIDSVNHFCPWLYRAHFTRLLPDSAAYSLVACDSVTLHGSFLDASGNYTFSLTNQQGCDSIITVDLTLWPSYDTLLTVVTCDEPYTDHGFDATTSGPYSLTLSTVHNCDSLLRLDFTRLIPFDTLIDEEIFAPDTYIGHGFHADEEGSFGLTFSDRNGCDSIYRLNLRVIDLRFPNAVTANGDGINDRFEIFDLLRSTRIEHSDLYIYTRDGRLIYHAQDITEPSQFWDPNETHSPTGTYFFRFQCRTLSHAVDRRGVIEVLR